MSDLNSVAQPQGTPQPALTRRLVRVLTSNWAARVTVYILLLLAWQLLSMIVSRVPGPVEVLVFIVTEITEGKHGGVVQGQFWKHFFVTMERFAVGLAIAITVGGLLGAVIGSSSYARALLNDSLLVFLALPAIIWAFLTVMWFGIGAKAPVATVALSAFPFIAVNVAQGIWSIGPDPYKMSRAFGVPVLKQLRHLVFPAVLGYVFAGIRFAVIISWNGVLLSEWFGSGSGVGFRARIWYDANRYRGFVAWILIFVVFILILDQLILTRLERRAFRWRDAQVELTDAMDLGATVTIAKWEAADG